MVNDIKNIEKEAHQLFEKHEYQKASELFSQAATHYQKLKQHKEASFLFASAASSWGLKAGEKALFYHAAIFYKKAAQEAEKAADFEYASTLYKHAGICYERDLEFAGFAECFYLSKECYRKHITSALFLWKKSDSSPETSTKFNLIELAKRFVSWFSLTFSCLLWGHGERPQRTLVLAGFIIFISAFLYTQGQLIKNGLAIKPNMLEAIFFSMFNFTHVGYWDVKPIGVNIGIAAFESVVSGIFIIPIFITGLCRKYLRFL